MKANRIIPLLLLFILATLVLTIELRFSEEPSPDQAFAGIETIQKVDPTLTPEAPERGIVPLAVEKPKTPVQPIEERRDSMLFETEALFGMPFDQAIAMPFD